MKRKTAKELLADSFRELAEIHDADKITVGEIVANCGYSSATFYRHFIDKYDLIAWDYSRRAEEIMDKVDYEDYPWKNTLVEGIKLFEQEKQYLANLFLHTSGMDSFLFNMTELNDKMLQNCVIKSGKKDELDKELRICIHLYCHGTVAIICDWVLDKYEASAEELAEIFEKSLPDPLKPYLK